MIRGFSRATHVTHLSALGLALFLCACAGPDSGGSSGSAGIVASEATAANVARVGFLTDYAKLQPMPGGGGMLCWRGANVDWKRYDKVLIERIQVYLAAGSAQKPIDPSDLKTLLDYFHGALVKDLRPTTQISQRGRTRCPQGAYRTHEPGSDQHRG